MKINKLETPENSTPASSSNDRVLMVLVVVAMLLSLVGYMRA